MVTMMLVGSSVVFLFVFVIVRVLTRGEDCFVFDEEIEGDIVEAIGGTGDNLLLVAVSVRELALASLSPLFLVDNSDEPACSRL